MPIVPQGTNLTASGQSPLAQSAKPSETDLLMTAASMHEMGRLAIPVKMPFNANPLRDETEPSLKEGLKEAEKEMEETGTDKAFETEKELFIERAKHGELLIEHEI